MKVLIVDDSPDALALARARLAKEGLELVTADCGGTGLEMARKENPDLVLLDIDMPDISGFEVCRTMKAHPDLMGIPVIFLTGSSEVKDKVEGLNLGAVDYVTKPFDAFELAARVRAALRTKRLQDMLIRHANIDPLTEMPNRRALMDRLDQEWGRLQRHGGVLSFIMVDLDHFKVVNDTFGHQVGDRLLQAAAGAIATQCRVNDLAARYGGEEFGILVPDEDACGATGLAERCRRGIENVSLRSRQADVRITASFGVADIGNLSGPGALIRAADKALYDAKRGGRNRVQCATDDNKPRKTPKRENSRASDELVMNPPVEVADTQVGRHRGVRSMEKSDVNSPSD
jgi:two-component system, cell cycle response regulator